MTASTVRVRAATPDDARAVFAVHRASVEGLGPDAYDEDQVAAWGAGGSPDDYDFGADASRFVVAEVGSGAAGADGEAAGTGEEAAGAGEEGAEAGERGPGAGEEDDGVREPVGRVVGFGEVVLEPPEYLLEPADGEVRAVYVHPEAARQGVGSALLADLERRARVHGLGSLGLWASLNAVAFYEARGYRRVAERTHEFSGGVEGTVVEMRRDDLSARRRRSLRSRTPPRKSSTKN